MASGDNSPPPSFSSGGSRSLEPENPSNYYDEYPTQSPSMSNMTPNMPSNTNFSTDDQRSVTDNNQSYTGGPNHSSLQHGLGNSVTGFSAANNTRGPGQPGYDGGQAPGLEAALPDNRSSTTGFSNAFGEYEPAPSQSQANPRNPSNPGGSYDNSDQTYDQENNVGYSIVGRNFKNANLMDPYDYNGI